MEHTRVLIVEDELIVAFNMQQQLTRLGYDVPAVVASGADALLKIRHLRPDVVLMDVNIDGDMDGIETSVKIPENLDVAVIYVTAYSDEGLVQRARQTSPYGFIVKPFSEHDLHATIQMSLERRRKDVSLRQELSKLEAAEDVHNAALATARRERLEQVAARKRAEQMLQSVVEKAHESQLRIKSVSLILNTLYESHSFEQVNFKRFLETLVPALVASHNKDSQSVSVSIDAVEIELPMEQSIPCGLIVNELLANALSHAYPDDRLGKIRVELVLEKDGQLLLRVTDNGVGMKTGLVSGKTGMSRIELAQILARQMGASLTIEDVMKTRFAVRLPLDPEVNL
jgi:two-component sensor histidine kinase